MRVNFVYLPNPALLVGDIHNVTLKTSIQWFPDWLRSYLMNKTERTERYKRDKVFPNELVCGHECTLPNSEHLQLQYYYLE